jgi:kynurenine formamidase
MRLHVGSHADAPEHYVVGGLQIHDLPLETFVGPAVIVDLGSMSPAAPIDRSTIEGAARGRVNAGDRLLIRSGWDGQFGGSTWRDSSPYLTTSAIDWIASRRVRLLGMDFAHSKDEPGSAERYYLTRTFCAAGIVVLANLHLEHVDVVSGLLVAAPIHLVGVEAAPVRPLLLAPA